MVASKTAQTQSMKDKIRASVKHFAHILPGQAPLQDFVHHNTLYGYQHLEFSAAIAAAKKDNGANGYYSLEHFRRLYQQGRISEDQLRDIICADESLNADEILFTSNEQPIRRVDVYLRVLLNKIEPLTHCQLNWEIQENSVFEKIASGVNAEQAEMLLKSESSSNSADMLSSLWQACLDKLNVQNQALHPEELIYLSSKQAKRIIATIKKGRSSKQKDPEEPRIEHYLRSETDVLIKLTLNRVGEELTLRGLLLAITGQDLLHETQEWVVRFTSNYLDQGLAAWRADNKGATKNYYQAWRATLDNDLTYMLDDLPELQEVSETLADDAMTTLVTQLRYFGVPEDKWESYLQALALELPGWSGMFYWRGEHPVYDGLLNQIDIIDYLAVRLVMERLYAQRLCRITFNLAPNIDLLRWYFLHNRYEFFVRYSLLNLRIPEYIAYRANRTVQQCMFVESESKEWQQLAHMIWAWKHSPIADLAKGHNVYLTVWPMFLLLQHLGVNAKALEQVEQKQLESLFECFSQFDRDHMSFLFLKAYELQYRDHFISALLTNEVDDPLPASDCCESQLIFCMDDREESIRRHLEEMNETMETLGAAGFFGVAMNWQGLDDTKSSALCPIVVTPAHEIHEVAKSESVRIKRKHDFGIGLLRQFNKYLYNKTRSSLFLATLVSVLSSLWIIPVLVAKLWSPLHLSQLRRFFSRRLVPAVPSDITLTYSSENKNEVESAELYSTAGRQLGYTDDEQAVIVLKFLKAVGISQRLASLVILFGHGSVSENNPHRAAYDCGACSGRHGGPNARAFANMANRSETRQRLKKLGLVIPESIWFVGALHNTCDDSIIWYDLDRVPKGNLKQLESVKTAVKKACKYSAQERCRKFASAPLNPSLQRAYKHVIKRSLDFSQARPELGHATNAAAIIGRRSLSKGVFFDRRVFLISYDPTTDKDGKIVEAILLAAGPVGAGISLEYYFSSVNNDYYGCGSKVMHNISGFFGVIDGTQSDLRTGLPKQMIEIHEAMRLQVLVETSTEILTEIYQRQPELRELIGNGWILLLAKPPEENAVYVFDPDKGWLLWEGDQFKMKRVNCSKQCYSGSREHLPPILIRPEGGVKHG